MVIVEKRMQFDWRKWVEDKRIWAVNKPPRRRELLEKNWANVWVGGIVQLENKDGRELKN